VKFGRKIEKMIEIIKVIKNWKAIDQIGRGNEIEEPF
jgi:hypothetical protein